MKKLVLILLSAVAVNSFGMNVSEMMIPYQQNKPSASALILAGLGCVGASMWYASRLDRNHPMQITNTGGSVSNSSGGDVNNIFTSINLPPRTIGAIAPLIPAVFCFWYGFKNLNS